MNVYRSKSTTSTWNSRSQCELTANPLSGKLGADQPPASSAADAAEPSKSPPPGPGQRRSPPPGSASRPSRTHLTSKNPFQRARKEPRGPWNPRPPGRQPGHGPTQTQNPPSGTRHHVGHQPP